MDIEKLLENKKTRGRWPRVLICKKPTYIRLITANGNRILGAVKIIPVIKTEVAVSVHIGQDST
jgi:hypothetical protein